MSTHCMPNGFLGTSEVPVPNISGATITTYNPPTGTLRRGVVVFFHGLITGPFQNPVPPLGSAAGGAAFLLGDGYTAFGSVMADTLCRNLAYDGWVVLAVPAPEDNFVSIPASGVYNDINNDTGHGSRYLACVLHTWDHIYQYIQQTYGNWPVIVAGSSMGGWTALQVAINRTSQIVGYMANDVVTMFENVNPAYVPSVAFYNTNCSGLDLGDTALNAVTIPGIVGYGTVDSAAPYGGDSVAATMNGGTTGIAAASLTGMTVSGGSLNFLSSLGYVTLTGLTGGTSQGRATYSYASFSGSTFTTLALLAGSGTVGVGAAVYGGTIDTMLTNALGASQPITRMSTGQFHSLAVTDSGAYYAGTATTITALNALTTLQITPVQASVSASASQYLISTKCAIQGASGKWYVVTFAGIASPNLTTASIATTAIGGGGSGAEVINAGAPICNIGTAITGGYSNMSYPYWVSTTLDGTYPQTY